MKDWCMTSIHREHQDRWMYDKGGNWYFANEEDAVMFFMAWSER